MLNVEDLCAESDVLAYDSTVLETFGPSQNEVSRILRDKRTVAVQSWLALAMEKSGRSPIRHSVRRVPTQAFGYTASTFSASLSEKLGDKEFTQVDLGGIISSPADLLYVGFSEPFRALWATLIDSVNVNSLCISSATYWTGQWTPFEEFADGTMINSVAFAGSGRLSWRMPTDWEKRPLNTETTWRFWLKLQLSRPPRANTMLGQLLPVRTSRFTDPCAYYALSLLYGESWGAQRGEWQDKSKAYAEMADECLTGILGTPMVDDEFLLPDAESVKPADINSVRPPTQSDLTTWQRG